MQSLGAKYSLFPKCGIETQMPPLNGPDILKNITKMHKVIEIPCKNMYRSDICIFSLYRDVILRNSVHTDQ